MKPANLHTKISLDSADPNETKEIINLLGFLDGQTTNPTLIYRHPEAIKRLAEGRKFSALEILKFYQDVVKQISELIPKGLISIEVYADKNTSSEQMFKQGQEMFSWIPNAYIKYPTTKEGLIAAAKSVKQDMRIIMTLCFSQQQAAAIYAATKGAKKGQVLVAPYIGKIDDGGENGMNLIENIIKMYQAGDGHVEVLTASVRNLEHFLYAIKLGSEIITAPYKVLKEWGEKGKPLPDHDFSYHASNLRPIAYEEIDLNKNWQEYNIIHKLTDEGLQRFSDDWNALIK